MRLTVSRADLEEPAALGSALDAARGRGLRVLVRIDDAAWEPVEAWTGRLQALASAAEGRVDAWQLFGPEAAIAFDAREYAYLLKQARVALRAGGSEASIVSAPLGDDRGWAESLFAEDAGPYLDVVAAPDPATLKATVALRDRLQAARQERARRDQGACHAPRGLAARGTGVEDHHLRPAHDRLERVAHRRRARAVGFDR
ncbi:MAG TPA: hypothetical protein VJV75_03595, partial [Candidatus Polarisedimenticolia bacterium]|nr:hypothetical protein [Candidatus Polarisedimenticolia bacterium]